MLRNTWRRTVIPAAILLIAIFALTSYRFHLLPSSAQSSSACTKASVQRAINSITEPQVRQLLTTLAPDGTNRAAGTPLNQHAVNWAAATMAGWGLAVQKQPFMDHGETFENVVATVRGSGCNRYAAEGHIDSVKASPGADDDGSGTVAAMVIGKALSTVPACCLKASVDLVLFNDEENDPARGGSWTYAKSVEGSLKEAIVMDRIGNGTAGVHSDYNPNYAGGRELADTVLATKRSYGIDNLTMTRGVYTRRNTNTASFWDLRIPATNIWETETSPHRHKPTDTVNRLNIRQITLIARAVAATLAELAMNRN